MENLSKLQWRYATKKFDANKKLSKEQLNTLLESIRLTPTSYGLQQYKVLVIENPELRAKLKDASWGQTQITDASQILVFTVPTNFGDTHVDHFLDLTAKTRGIDRSTLKTYEDLIKGGKVGSLTPQERITWLAKQAYIALGFLLYTAAEINVDACPMEGFDPSQYDEILGLKAKNLTTVLVCPVGFRASDDKYQELSKVRKCNEELFETIQ